jgi:hypothetical protein
MEWTVLIGDEFEPEFLALRPEVQDDTLAMARLLRHSGPNLGRPHFDTLKDSKHANMKEMRFDAAGGVWRVAPSRLIANAGDPACLRRQVGWQPEAFLSRTDPQSRSAVRCAPRPHQEGEGNRSWPGT